MLNCYIRILKVNFSLLRQRIILSFVICEVLTFLLFVAQKQLGAFLPSLLIHLACFLVVSGVAVFLKRGQLSLEKRYYFSVAASLLVMLTVLWQINGGEFIPAVTKLLGERSFWFLAGPYAVSCIAGTFVNKFFVAESN